MTSDLDSSQRAEKIEPISAFLYKHIRNADFGLYEDIFASGFVNSLFALQLVTFIESHFDLSIEDDDLVLENFNSISAMVAFVERKQASRG